MKTEPSHPRYAILGKEIDMPGHETATLGGGCFWCVEAAFQELRGVQKVVSGYAGGAIADPSYKQVCSGRTGHAEVVQITFDPAEISYDDLLRVFFTIHDPTTPDRQGADIGTQYRSIILTSSDQQVAAAQAVIDEITASDVWRNKIVTQVVPLDAFYAAEPEHQNFFARNPYHGYCQAVAVPKIAKLRKAFSDRLRNKAPA
jgi:peptide-methionine (S)-S-oxide reductase